MLLYYPFWLYFSIYTELTRLSISPQNKGLILLKPQGFGQTRKPYYNNLTLNNCLN